MKKILFIANDLDLGGIETTLVTLLEKFDYKNYQVDLLLMNKKGIFLKDIPKNVNIIEYKINDNKNIFIRKIFNFIKVIKFNIFNYNKYDVAILYATYLLAPIKFIFNIAKKKMIYVHNNYQYIYSNEIDYKAFFNNRKISKMDNIVFVSNEANKYFDNMYPELKEKTCTIHNMINYERINKLSKEKIKERDYYLYIGRMDEHQKRISLILKLAEKNKDCKFLFIGDGPDLIEYKKIAKKLKNVIFLGKKSNPYPYIKNSNGIIMTSNYEGFPTVLLEAVTLNKNYITTIPLEEFEDFGITCNATNLFQKFDEFKKNKLINKKMNMEIFNEKQLKNIYNIIN